MTKWNLFKHQATAMVAAKPTGASALTVTPAPVALVSAENSTEPVAKNDAFDEIKNKFLNEIDKIPREFSRLDNTPPFSPRYTHFDHEHRFGM